MSHPSRYPLLRTLPYLVLFVASHGFLLYFMPSSLSSLYSGSPVFYDRFPTQGEKMEVEVTCPTRAYEYETIEITLVVKEFGIGTPPPDFTVETSNEIEIEGNKERLIQFSKNWFLVPKEHGEYVIAVKGNGSARGYERDIPLTVFKIFGLSRRWFEGLLWAGSIAGLIGMIRGLLTPRKNKSAS
jgi:hypothetical protein